MICDKSTENFEDKENRIEYIKTLSHKDSIVIIVNQSSNCEQFNNLIINAKKQFIRLAVGKGQSYEYLDNSNDFINSNEIEAFCIYSTNPLDQQIIINSKNWYQYIINVSLDIKCSSCHYNNYACFEF